MTGQTPNLQPVPICLVCRQPIRNMGLDFDRKVEVYQCACGASDKDVPMKEPRKGS